MKLGKPDEDTLLIFTIVLGFGISTEGQLRLIVGSVKERLEVRRLLADL
jgi:hypothetical protein